MNQLKLTEAELEQRIDSFLTRKFNASDIERRTKLTVDRTERRSAPALQWRQYAL